jgi:hypothetical protein
MRGRSFRRAFFLGVFGGTRFVPTLREWRGFAGVKSRSLAVLGMTCFFSDVLRVGLSIG